MKNIYVSLVLAGFVCSVGLARQGEHDGDPNHNDGRTISCREKTSPVAILQFVSTQNQAQVEMKDYTLVVKAKGDDVGEISITDKRSGDTVKVKRLEELLKITLVPDESDQPTVYELKTHRGYAEAQVLSPNSADVVQVKSSSRRGQSIMEVKFVTDENPNSPIEIVCQKAR